MKIKLILLLVTAGFSSLFGLEDPFLTVRALLKNEAPTEEILSRLETVRAGGGTFRDSADLFQAEYYRLLGFAHMKDDNKKEAKAALQESIVYAEREKERSGSAPSYFILSSSGFMLAGLKGVGSIISESETLNGYVDKALEMAPDDPAIILQKAASITFPPKAFGGNPAAAVVLLERALALPDVSDPDLFDILSILSYAYEKENRKREALDAVTDALALYSGSEELNKRRDKLAKKVK